MFSKNISAMFEPWVTPTFEMVERFHPDRLPDEMVDRMSFKCKLYWLVSALPWDYSVYK